MSDSKSAIDPAHIDRLSPREKPPQSPAMHQRWAYLLFLHWEVPAEALQKLVPSGVTIDTFDGKAYIGLVPFTMTGVRPLYLPALSVLSNFHETNVRTYVHDGGKNPGVYFFSLEAANLIAVKLGRWLFRLNYQFAAMSLQAAADTQAPGIVEYTSQRRGSAPPLGLSVRYEVTGPPRPATPDTLEHFLVERYILYTEKNGRLFRGRVHHAPYPVQPARLLSLDENLLASNGVIRPDSPPLVHYASEVQVQLYSLEEAK